MYREFTGICSGFGDTNGETGRIRPTEGALQVAIGDRSVEELPYNDLELSLGGHGDRYICFTRRSDPQSRVMIRDKGVIQTLRRLGAPGTLLRQWDDIGSQRVRRSSLVAAAFSVGLLLVGLAGWWVIRGVPRLVDRVVAHVPAEWEQELGRLGASQILSEHAVCTSPALKMAMGKIATRLAGAMRSVPQNLKVAVIDAPDVNAVALPAGYIFVHRELVEAADSAEEVAGVLAHEMQHVVLRHGVTNLVRQAGLWILVGALIGDAGALEQFLGYNALGLLSMEFSREQEREADAEGLKLLGAAAIPGEPMARFFDKLAQNEQDRTIAPAVLSTHPDSSARAAALRALMGSLAFGSGRSFEIDWSRIKNSCDPERIVDPKHL